MKSGIFYRVVLSLSLIWMSGEMQPGQAQTLFGSLVGNVKDATDAAVAGATVTLTNLETAVTRQSATTDAGSYDFPTIPAGSYELKIAREGFNPHTETGIEIEANNTVRVDVSLHIGAIAESVTVSGAAALLQTDRAEVRHDVTTEQLSNLPMSIGRNYQTLFVTLPGFGGIQSSYNSTPSNPSKALVFNVNRCQFQHQ